MDGTLLNSQKQIDKKSLKMIKQAADMGKIIVLSTGRCLPELKIFGQQLKDIHYFICISGAVIYDNFKQEIIYSTSIPENTAIELFNRVSSEDLMINYFSDKSVIERDKVEIMENYHMGIYKDVFKKITFQVNNIIEHFMGDRDKLFKINLYSRTIEQREKLLKKINDINLTFAYSEVTSIECSPKGISKASGLQYLCEKLQIPIEKTIAVGDADNDIEILKVAGLSIAMGNANTTIKQIADIIVNDNDNSGCAQVIQQFLLK